MTNSPSLPSLHGESKKILSQKVLREAAIKGCWGPASPIPPGAVRRARMWCGIPLELTHHMFLRWCSVEPEGGHNGSPFLNHVEGFQRFNRLPRGDEWRGSHIPCIIRAPRFSRCHTLLQHPSGRVCTSGTPGAVSKTEQGRGGAILSSSPREGLWEATARRAGDFEKEVGWRGWRSRDGFPWFRV